MPSDLQAPLWDDTTMHASREQLDAALPHIQAAPLDGGTLRMIVRRPARDQREVLQEASLSTVEGLLGDSWLKRGASSTPDRSADPDMQINIMNARCTAAVAGEKSRWPLAGDQLYLDMDLSHTNLPTGSRLAIGTAIVEITEPPHLGCRKFQQRYGRDAVSFVNSDLGKQLRLRGLNARVVRDGVIAVGDTARKIV